jgi:hypothetical protein
MADADRVVVELLAKVDQFDQPVKQSAAKFNQSMDQIAASATKAENTVTKSSASRASAIERESAQVTQFTKALARDMVFAGDILTSDRSPFVVPVKQAPAATASIKVLGTAATALGGIMETVAGVGIALLIAALIDLIAKSKSANEEIDDAVEKLKKDAHQTEVTEAAKKAFGQTLEGVTQALKKNREALQDLSEEGKTAAERAVVNAKAQLLVAQINEFATQSEINYTRALLERNRALSVGPETKGHIDPAMVAANRQGAALDSLQQQLNGWRAAVAEAQSQITEAESRVAVDAGMRDAAERIKRLYEGPDGLIEKTRQRLVNEKATTAEIEKQVRALHDREQAEIKAARDADKPHRSGEFGRTVSFDDASAIARGAGFSVTSAYRSTAHQAELYNDPSVNRPGNPVARPGTSAHEGVNGKWALDIAFAPGLTPEKLRKVYGDEGVSLTAVYKERGHFHIEGRRTQGEIAADRDAIAAQKAAERQEQILDEMLFKEQDISVVKERQLNLAQDYYRAHGDLNDLIDSGILPSLDAWNREYQQIIDSQQELNRFGGQLIDDVLNPDNWNNWGDAAKRILHDIMGKLLQMAAINPLKNMLFGSNLPTLSGGLAGLFGGGGGGINVGALESGNAAALSALSGTTFSFRAGGGPVSAGQSYIVGEDGPEIFQPTSSGIVIPNDKSFSPSNGRALPPGATAAPGHVLVQIEASKYFDGRVMQVTGPVIAQSSVASVNGGATLARQNLARESMHRLE